MLQSLEFVCLINQNFKFVPINAKIIYSEIQAAIGKDKSDRQEYGSVFACPGF